MHSKTYLIILFLSVFVSEAKSWTDAADITPPKEYIQTMEQFNGYFHFKRLDLIERLFLWESGYNPLKQHKNVDGTTDYGIAMVNSKYLDPNRWNYIEMYWKPAFPNLEFDWKNPQMNIFIGMSIFKDCLDYSGNYFDALICYNWGMGKYKSVYAPDMKHCKLPQGTKNIIEFVFEKEYWNDNLNYHWLPTPQRDAKLKEIADAKRAAAKKAKK